MRGQTNRCILESKWPRLLRNSPTDAGRALWQRLKGRQLEGCKFRRQNPFGDYILDFVCLERGVVVELDGSQHMAEISHDAQRTLFLESAGFVVLRFWNNDVLGNLNGVVEMLQKHLISEATPFSFTTPSPPNPPLEGEG